MFSPPVKLALVCAVIFCGSDMNFGLRDYECECAVLPVPRVAGALSSSIGDLLIALQVPTRTTQQTLRATLIFRHMSTGADAV
eukprot:4425207-Pyramimonas_sp.AAC.1